MNKSIIITILIISSLFGCQTEGDKDIYKTKGGEYASKNGKFIAKFPVKPTLQIIENQLGLDKFQINHFQCSFGPQQIYSVEYTDFPDYYLKNWEAQEYYENVVKAIENKYEDLFILAEQSSIEQNGLKGQEFVFNLNEKSAKLKGVTGYVEGKIFKIGNRIYTITYSGENNKKVEPFISSFRLLKNKK